VSNPAPTTDPVGSKARREVDVCHIAFGGLGGQSIVVRMLAEQFDLHGLRSAVILHAQADEMIADPSQWPHLDPVVPVPRRGKIDPAAMIAVARTVRRLRPRAVLCHSHETVAAAHLGQVLGGRRPRVVLVEHQSIALRHRAEDLRSLLALPFCRAVVLLSDDYARRYRFRRLPLRAIRRTTIIPNGIDTDLFRPHPRPATADFVLGRGCRLIPIKDLDTLIDAAAILVGQPGSEQVRLRIAGDGPERAALQTQVRRLGIDDHVEFLGTLDETEMPAFYSSLDAYVLATLGETSSPALLEAYASALPVVASDVDGVHDFVRDGHDGLLVPPQDAEAMADVIGRLMNDRDLGRRLGSAARRRVSVDCSARAMADGYLALLSELGLA
jgi:glycosyltransferase involved in cell wall biosynthesis